MKKKYVLKIEIFFDAKTKKIIKLSRVKEKRVFFKIRWGFRKFKDHYYFNHFLLIFDHFSEIFQQVSAFLFQIT